MKKLNTAARVAAVSAGMIVLTGVAGAGIATADENHGDGVVDVTVEIPQIDEPGVLALTVAGESMSLAENGSDDLVRQFTGTLPTVTVTDTRTADEIPEGAYWYVIGSATDFAGAAGEPAIGAEHLGWAPRLLDADPGSVAAGDEVHSVVDSSQFPDNVGLVDEELFAMAFDSQDIVHEGQWTATADLKLRTPATVAPGSYASTLTLSLFE
ncbi:hypothetical protein [Agromyces laixinhei]|uniref:hypothetical protein n=1 Tax=Agromyces laixinhei TaxID=2585717 RepID=UPI0012EDEE46|nr:hypothetical protein [Agromyces laixinhei]